jgi:hypothetical protein
MTTPLNQALTTLAPLAVLGVVLLVLLFAPMPAANKDIATTIVAGLLGFLARGEQAHPTTLSPSAGAPPAGNGSDSEAQ